MVLGPKSRRRGGLLAAALMAAVLGAPGRLEAQSGDPARAERTVLDGVYSAAQAARGKDAFLDVCAQCHTSSQFRGAGWRRLRGERPVREYFEQIRTSMPIDNPGGLARDEYAAIIAYILQLNGYPAGPAALPADSEALRAIRFAPLPDTAAAAQRSVGGEWGGVTPRRSRARRSLRS